MQQLSVMEGLNRNKEKASQSGIDKSEGDA
jgi:hypothetical protein